MKLVFTLIASCLAWTSLFGIEEVKTEGAPKAIGPYSQAVRAGDFLFISGQIPTDPATGKLVGGRIAEQTNQAINNIEAILAAQNLTLKDVVRAEVYLKDLNDFKEMNAVYANRFASGVKPARHTVQVSKLPMDALIEITTVAYAPR